MPFGINSASEVFQRAMEQIFTGFPCAIIANDIVGGKGEKEHNENLRKVLNRARQVNLKLNPQKCKFRLKEVSYVDHLFTERGLKPDPTKIQAITEMPLPKEKNALQSFLGMANYLGKFIPNFSELAAPLRQLLHRDVAWCWSQHQQEAFYMLKKMHHIPTSAEVLWCEQTSDHHVWCFSIWIGCSMPTKRSAHQLCFRYSHWNGNEVCSNRKGAIGSGLCLSEVLWLHLWKAGLGGNRPSTPCHDSEQTSN